MKWAAESSIEVLLLELVFSDSVTLRQSTSAREQIAIATSAPVLRLLFRLAVVLELFCLESATAAVLIFCDRVVSLVKRVVGRRRIQKTKRVS